MDMQQMEDHIALANMERAVHASRELLYRCSDVTPTVAIMTLLSLLSVPDGTAVISIGELSTLMRRSRRAIRASIAEIEAMGYFTILRRPGCPLMFVPVIPAICANSTLSFDDVLDALIQQYTPT
jgi:hypothetical protein